MWPGEKQNETGIVTEIMKCKVDGESLPICIRVFSAIE